MDAFPDDFQRQLTDLMRWRHDVRDVRSDPADEAVPARRLDAFRLAPPVGLSEPWRVLRLTSERARAATPESFQHDRSAGSAGGLL